MVVGELQIELMANIARLSADMRRAEGVVDQATGAMARAAGLAKMALGAMAGVLSVGAFAGFIKGAADATAGLHDMSIQTGASVASLMAFKSIAATTDTTIDDIAKAMNRFAKGMTAADEESKGIGRAVQSIGLDFSALKAMAPEQQMLTIAKALDRFEDGAFKASVAMTFYGKSGAAMLPYLGDLAAQSGEVTSMLTAQEIATQKAAAALADDFGDNLAKISKLSGDWARDISNGMMPALVEVTGEILRAAEGASGFAATMRQATADGTVAEWSRDIVDSLKKFVAAAEPAAKIGAAYIGAFVLAPLLFQGTATALGNLNLQIALARMEMASGTPIAGLFARSVDSVGVSALWASGMLGKLKIATSVLFAGFVGWEIGKYLEDQFVQVKVFAEVLTGAVLEMWEHIKLGTKLALDVMTAGWRAAFSGMTATLAPVYEGMAAGLRKLGFDEKAAQIAEFAGRVRAAGEAQGTFASRTAEARAEHERNILAIRKVTQTHINAIVVADAVSEATRGAAAATTATGNAAGAAAGATAKHSKATVDLAKAMKEAADFEQAYSEALGMTASILADRVKSAEDEAARNEELARTYGMTKVAIEAEELARLENELAQRSSLGLTLDEIDALEKLIAAKKRNTAALGAMEQADATNKAREEWQRAAESIEQSLTDALLRGFESGKSFGRNLIDTLKNMFQTLVLRPIIQPMMAPISGSLAGMIPGSAQAAGGATGGVSGLSSLWTNGSALLNGSMINYGATKGVTGAANYLMDSSNPMLQKMGASLGNNAGMLSSGLGMLGNGMAGYGISKGLSGGYSAGNWVNIAAGIASAIPGIGPIAGVVGALVNRAFGMKAKEYGASALSGNLGGNGFSGTIDTSWTQKGGWFRSDKTGVDKVAVDAAMSKQLTSAYDAIKAASADFASVLGINADSIKDRAQSLSIALGKDEAANQKAIADFFVGVGNTIAGELLPSLSTFQQEGEAASATLQRLATGYALVDTALTSIGMSFGAVGTASLEARERLLAAAGGLEAFAANTAGFQQNFLSEMERNAPVLKMVTEQLAAMGLSSVDTRDEFKQVVLGLDLTTEAGAKQYGALMRLQAAFAQVYPTTEAVTAALAEQAQAAKQAAEAQLQAAEATRQAAIQATKDRASSLLSGVDSMFSALQSVVNREKSLLQESANAHRALSSALRGTLDSMSVAGNELESRQGARAQIQSALAIARAGGALPDADSLKGALSVLSKDASSMFSTQQDYLRDFYSTQNDIAALAGLTDDALSVEEKSLKALDGILESAQQQINALKGVDYSLLTLAQASSGFKGALGAAQADPVASAGGGIAKLYKDLFGRAADSAGLDYWKDQVAGGLSLAQVKQFMMQSAEYKTLRGFAVGTNYVPTNMPAMIHEGERIIPAADNRELMRRLSSPQQSGAVLAAAVERLTKEVEGLRVEARATATHTEKSSRLLSRVIRENALVITQEEE